MNWTLSWLNTWNFISLKLPLSVFSSLSTSVNNALPRGNEPSQVGYFWLVYIPQFPGLKLVSSSLPWGHKPELEKERSKEGSGRRFIAWRQIFKEKINLWSAGSAKSGIDCFKMTSGDAWLTRLCLIWGDGQAVCVRWRWETTLEFLSKLSRRRRWGGWKMSGNSQNLPCSGMPAEMTALWVLLTSPPNDWVDVSHKSFLWFSAYTRFPLKGTWAHLFSALEFGLLLTKVSDTLSLS